MTEADQRAAVRALPDYRTRADRCVQAPAACASSITTRNAIIASALLLSTVLAWPGGRRHHGLLLAGPVAAAIGGEHGQEARDHGSRREAIRVSAILLGLRQLSLWLGPLRNNPPTSRLARLRVAELANLPEYEPAARQRTR
jgi:hypothetical protein